MTETRKTIFITGGGSGIGRAVAIYFANKGWFVGLADINAKGLEETAALLPQDRSSIHIMDVTDRSQWANALEDFVKAGGGRLDVLFNNAGLGYGGEFADLSPDRAERLIAVNFNGVVNGIYEALPFLKQTPGSAIVNTCSAAGLYGAAGLSVYSATKFAVRGLTEALDIEFADLGIKVRSIMPSFIDTPLLDETVPGSNQTSRERVKAAGLEFTPVEVVAETVWNAAHGNKVHSVVGKTAKKLAFAARWMPGKIRTMRRKMNEQ